jgi:hypothetical protein
MELSISLAVAGIRPGETAHGMRCDGVGGSARHGSSGHHWQVLLIVHSRLRVQTFLWSNMSESGVSRWLLEVGSGWVRARVVADQVEVLACRCGDTEGLLHETVGLIPVSIGAFVRSVTSIIVATSALWRLPWS